MPVNGSYLSLMAHSTLARPGHDAEYAPGAWDECRVGVPGVARWDPYSIPVMMEPGPALRRADQYNEARTNIIKLVTFRLK